MRTWFRRWMCLCTWMWFCSWMWLPISRTCSYFSRSLWNTSEGLRFPRVPEVECLLLQCSYAIHTLESHAYCVTCTEDTWKITSRGQCSSQPWRLINICCVYRTVYPKRANLPTQPSFQLFYLEYNFLPLVHPHVSTQPARNNIFFFIPARIYSQTLRQVLRGYGEG